MRIARSAHSQILGTFVRASPLRITNEEALLGREPVDRFQILVCRGRLPRDVRKNFAAEMGYSRAYLTRKLTQQWSRSPGLILREVRLLEAAKQLRTTRLSVNEVATKVGYSTAVGFCRAFKRTFGETPHAYIVRRRLHRAAHRCQSRHHG